MTSVAIAGVLAAGIIAFLLSPSTPTTAADEFSPAQKNEIGNIIRSYLLKNPEVIEEAVQVLQDRRVSKAIQSHWDEIINPKDAFIAGNPKGDATVVEFFDYRCPYCKQVQPSVVKLRKADPKLRVVYREFPILSEESVVAAHAAIAARKQGKYLQFHDAMMAARGDFSTDMIMSIAKKVGLDTDKLKKDMKDPAVDDIIARTRKLGEEIGINGTPGFIFGKKLVPGAVTYDEMLSLVADARSSNDGTKDTSSSD
ncbi:MAG TPA: DsbA family protein [Alphaproteobacteria bacterium]|nr:DsbA family protein [Alphaproteobacteria bacterium]